MEMYFATLLAVNFAGAGMCVSWGYYGFAAFNFGLGIANSGLLLAAVLQ